MKLVALSGGIASGKSFISRRLAELGAVVIDADVLAREAVAPGSVGLKLLRDEFGDAVINETGDLNRAALADLVFSDSGARDKLNEIVHPEVRRLAQSRIASATKADENAIVIYDVPLLVEAGVDMPWNLVVIADAPAEVRKQRLVDLRGMSEAAAENRIKSQASDEARRAVADVLINTAGTEAETLRQIDALWAKLQQD